MRRCSRRRAGSRRRTRRARGSATGGQHDGWQRVAPVTCCKQRAHGGAPRRAGFGLRSFVSSVIHDDRLDWYEQARRHADDIDAKRAARRRPFAGVPDWLGSERPSDQPFGVRGRERMRGHCGVHGRERGRGRRGNVILEERLMALSRAGGTDPGAGRYELGATLRKPANNATS